LRHLEKRLGLGLVSVSGKSGKVSSRSRLEQTFKRLGLVSISKKKVSFTSLPWPQRANMLTVQYLENGWRYRLVTMEHL